jgi:hypothetical protein
VGGGGAVLVAVYVGLAGVVLYLLLETCLQGPNLCITSLEHRLSRLLLTLQCNCLLRVQPALTTSTTLAWCSVAWTQQDSAVEYSRDAVIWHEASHQTAVHQTRYTSLGWCGSMTQA